MKKILILFFCFLSYNAFPQKSIVFTQAKFHTGDQPEWKDLNFDDSKWASIKTTIKWEEQGYKKYDGYAWYRLKFKLNPGMKQHAYWQDTLSVLLSKIDDMDEAFLNGVKIGQTGAFPTDASGYIGKWDTDRIYNVASNSKFINWDGENVVAVRVFDHSNGGGMFGVPPSVKMLEPVDEIRLLLEADPASSNLYRTVLTNISRKTIEGIWTVAVKDGGENKTIKSFSKTIVLKAFEKLKDSITVSGTNRLEVVSSFTEKHTGEVKSAIKVTPYILTPAASPIPHINSAKVFGVRPGSPFLFKIAATGSGVLKYQAIGLPAGLKVNASSGIITGTIGTKGDYKVHLIVSNKLGNATQAFTIRAGERLSLTPPMGWNSWNCWGLSVTDEKVMKSAQALMDKGLINHGWNFVNIDDGWESAERSKDGLITTNSKFKDMAMLGSWLHNKGLKFGIYSSPGPQTCGGYLGSYQHELQDAETYNKWGIDFLKYDWCSYEFLLDKDTSLNAYQQPYRVMQKALKAQPRDIVYSLCQYGLKDVWKWGDELDGNAWRTTGDLKDNWESLRAFGFKHPENYPYAKPGNWNDPDMLMVGKVGGWSGTLRPTLLTPDEQYTHISLWCLLSAPLLIGCDLASMDKFTLSLLTNDEVIAVDQDVLGRQARQMVKTNDYEIWVKDLEDGSKAVGLFNVGSDYKNIRVDFSKLNLKGSHMVRDLWRQKNIGRIKDGYTANIPSHGVVLIKITR